MKAVRDYVQSLGTPPPPLCARVMKGLRPEDFQHLSDERGRILSWVSPPEQVAVLLAESARPLDWMHAIGYDPAWIDARIADGTEFRLALFPAPPAVSPEQRGEDAPKAGAFDSAFQVTWDALFARLAAMFGEDVAAAVLPHEAALKATPFEEIDPEGELCSVTLLPAPQKLADPRYMTIERFRERLQAESSPVSLYEARALFYHAIGCSKLFRGDGVGVNGGAEWAILNRPLARIPGLVAFPFPAEC